VGAELFDQASKPTNFQQVALKLDNETILHLRLARVATCGYTPHHEGP
jgi:hypothetical protein